MVVSRGKVYQADELPGFTALIENEPAGLLTYRIEQEEMEIVTLDSVREGRGVGSSLIEAARELAVKRNCRRIWLITTNDNLSALGFYQKRSFKLRAVYPEALEQSRRLKPQIPMSGKEGIPLRDEIELELIPD